jgi:dipeptide/tripeptide permease
MGINLGAFIAPLICSYLGEKIDWHLGFGVAGVGMTLGVIQYVVGGKRLAARRPRPVLDPGVVAQERAYRDAALMLLCSGAVAFLWFGPERAVRRRYRSIILVTGVATFLDLALHQIPASRRRRSRSR